MVITGPKATCAFWMTINNFIIACSSCHSKVKATLNKKYLCLLCKQDVVAVLRLIVVLSVIDQTGTMDITAIDQVAERMLQTTTEAMEELHKAGEKLPLDSVKEDLGSGKYIICLSKTPENDRMLLRSYSHQGMPTIEATSSSSIEYSTASQNSYSTLLLEAPEKEPDLPLSPLKRQLGSITITPGTSTNKQLLLNEGRVDMRAW